MDNYGNTQNFEILKLTPKIKDHLCQSTSASYDIRVKEVLSNVEI